jgi:hypothetical protein
MKKFACTIKHANKFGARILLSRGNKNAICVEERRRREEAEEKRIRGENEERVFSDQNCMECIYCLCVCVCVWGVGYKLSISF